VLDCGAGSGCDFEGLLGGGLEGCVDFGGSGGEVVEGGLGDGAAAVELGVHFFGGGGYYYEGKGGMGL
jgi:hypothetical protein